MAGSPRLPTKERRTRKPGVFAVYRGIALANTDISRAARTRELYQAMKATQDGAGA